jgi:hypothetical protein
VLVEFATSKPLLSGVGWRGAANEMRWAANAARKQTTINETDTKIHKANI